jgi:hypothetical protein
MSNTNELTVILNEIVHKYIKEYFNVYVPKAQYSEKPAVVINKDLVSEVVPKKVNKEIFAIDGSSRSITSAGGIISISTIASSSSSFPIYGVYPSLFGMRSLDLDKPFIALAPSAYSKGSLNPYLYSSKYVTTVSLDGTPFQSTQEPERIETELRAILETEGLKKLKGKGLVLVDGPLFPSYTFLPEKAKKIIIKRRIEIIDDNYIGVVKRLDKSDLLIKTLSNNPELISRYKVDPRGFLSDEAFLYQLVRFNFNPPYPIISVGPLLKEVDDKVKIYVNYLIFPLHKYLPKFSILRVESLNREAVAYISSLKFTTEGIPSILALADKASKELSAGIMRYIVFSIEKIGLQESFKGKFEVLNVV